MYPGCLNHPTNQSTNPIKQSTNQSNLKPPRSSRGPSPLFTPASTFCGSPLQTHVVQYNPFYCSLLHFCSHFPFRISSPLHALPRPSTFSCILSFGVVFIFFSRYPLTICLVSFPALRHAAHHDINLSNHRNHALQSIQPLQYLPSWFAWIQDITLVATAISISLHHLMSDVPQSPPYGTKCHSSATSPLPSILMHLSLRDSENQNLSVFAVSIIANALFRISRMTDCYFF